MVLSPQLVDGNSGEKGSRAMMEQIRVLGESVCVLVGMWLARELLIEIRNTALAYIVVRRGASRAEVCRLLSLLLWRRGGNDEIKIPKILLEDIQRLWDKEKKRREPQSSHKHGATLLHYRCIQSGPKKGQLWTCKTSCSNCVITAAKSIPPSTR